MSQPKKPSAAARPKRRRAKRPTLTNFLAELKLDRGALEVVGLHDEPDDPAYWRQRTPEERLRRLELLRQLNYGYARCAGRLQRVLEVVERRKG